MLPAVQAARAGATTILQDPGFWVFADCWYVLPGVREARSQSLAARKFARSKRHMAARWSAGPARATRISRELLQG